MSKKDKPSKNVDDTIDVRRKLKEAGKEPVPEPSDKLKKKYD